MVVVVVATKRKGGSERAKERENEKVVESRREFMRENDVGEVVVEQRCRRVKKRQQSSCHVKKGVEAHARVMRVYRDDRWVTSGGGEWMREMKSPSRMREAARIFTPTNSCLPPQPFRSQLKPWWWRRR